MCGPNPILVLPNDHLAKRQRGSAGPYPDEIQPRLDHLAGVESAVPAGQQRAGAARGGEAAAGGIEQFDGRDAGRFAGQAEPTAEAERIGAEGEVGRRRKAA